MSELAFAKRTGYRMADRELGYDGDRWSETCFQRKLRDSLDNGERLSLDNWRVEFISFHEAQDFILQFEWLGTMGTTMFSIGLYLEDVLSGVLCFGVTAGTQVFSEPFGKENRQYGIVLVRGACAPWAHPHAASFLIGKAMPLVASKRYGFVIAYSDPEAGEIGTVYQATNWNFYGFTSSVTCLVRPDGKRCDPKIISKYAKKANVSYAVQKQTFLDEGYSLHKGSKKLKYLKLVGDRRMKARLMHSKRVEFYPYIKRVEDMRNVYAQFQSKGEL